MKRLSFLILLFCFAVVGCNREDERAEYAYVANPQVVLRDRVAAVYNKTGTVASGDRVRVIDRSQNKRFVKVRTADGREGWMEQRYLVTQGVYDAFQKLAKENENTPVQAGALARRLVNIRIQPARNADTIFQVKENGKVQLLKRASTPRSGLKKSKDEETEQSKDEEDSERASVATDPNDPLEDWWLIRDEQGHVGWVLGRMIDVDIPLDIAQYAEGQRIVAAFVLNQVPESRDAEKKVPQYAVLLTDPKDGLPFDFNQVRIFTWNAARTRYETAYRERLVGLLPFRVGMEDFGKEGKLPVFVARAKDNAGAVIEKKYKLIGPIVRRVPAPTEAAGAAKKSSSGKSN